MAQNQDALSSVQTPARVPVEETFLELQGVALKRWPKGLTGVKRLSEFLEDRLKLEEEYAATLVSLHSKWVQRLETEPELEYGAVREALVKMTAEMHQASQYIKNFSVQMKFSKGPVHMLERYIRRNYKNPNYEVIKDIFEVAQTKQTTIEERIEKAKQRLLIRMKRWEEKKEEVKEEQTKSDSVTHLLDLELCLETMRQSVREAYESYVSLVNIERTQRANYMTNIKGAWIEFDALEVQRLKVVKSAMLAFVRNLAAYELEKSTHKSCYKPIELFMDAININQQIDNYNKAYTRLHQFPKSDAAGEFKQKFSFCLKEEEVFGCGSKRVKMVIPYRGGTAKSPGFKFRALPPATPIQSLSPQESTKMADDEETTDNCPTISLCSMSLKSDEVLGETAETVRGTFDMDTPMSSDHGVGGYLPLVFNCTKSTDVEVLARRDYRARCDGELSFKKGQSILQMAPMDVHGMSFGCIRINRYGQKVYGYYPAGHVEFKVVPPEVKQPLTSILRQNAA